ncbi:uncharacterized protein ATC70_005473 [Mucor velutinosus]|uniref:Uncharacterized protein n=1 Tax=Mucor velutinosus TaxID=708070 RepID=A0AAN7HZF5_9FUNG|nr:hypothetical protein ATC70_005473 [Mucor velutinosus]
MARSLLFISLAVAATVISSVSAVVPEPIATANVDNTKNFDPAEALNTTHSANVSASGFTCINLSTSGGIPLSTATAIFVPTTGMASATATASASVMLSSASAAASFSGTASANVSEITSSVQQPIPTGKQGKKVAKKASKKSKKDAKKSSEKAEKAPKKAKKASKKSKKAAEASRV